MQSKQDILKQIQELEKKLKNSENVKSQILIDDDDNYQQNLELMWYKEEIRDQIEELKKTMTNENK